MSKLLWHMWIGVSLATFWLWCGTLQQAVLRAHVVASECRATNVLQEHQLDALYRAVLANGEFDLAQERRKGR